MSSLRLALKQSLQETGHLAPPKKQRRKRNSNSPSRRRQQRKQQRQQQQQQQPGDPPRKRGRPRKHPRPDELGAMVALAAVAASASNGHHGGDSSSQQSNPHSQTTSHSHQQPHPTSNHHNSARTAEEDEESSENEFSYDSEEEETEDEEEDEEEEDGEDDDEEEDEDDEDDDGEEEEEEDDDDDEEEEEDEEGELHETSTGGPLNRASGESNDDNRLPIKKIKIKHDRSDSDEERRRQRKLFKKQLNAAANKIQSHWKKSKAKSYSAENDDDTDAPSQPDHDSQTTATSGNKESSSQTAEASEPQDSASHKHGEKKTSQEPVSSQTQEAPKPNPAKPKKKRKDSDTASRTVPPPIPELLEWSRNLSERKCRKNIASGMRVKVRFSAKVKRDGKVVKKKIWYGGRVSAVSKEGSKIRIKYDDGTSEISKFPDKDVVVDETSNGQHLVDADRFLPPSMRGSNQQEEPEEEEFVDTEEMFDTSQTKSDGTAPPPPQPKEPEPTKPETKKEKDNSPEPASKKTDAAVTPVKVQTKPVESESKPEEPQEMEMTPPNKPQKPDESSRLPSGLLSPEEGELSPGITATKNPPKPEDNQSEAAEPVETKPSEMESETKTSPQIAPTEESAPPAKPTEESREEESREPQSVNAATATTTSGGSPGKSPDEKKSSLTIRIPNVTNKPKEGTPKPQTPKSPKIQTPKSPKAPSDGETSEEELFADTPVTQREVKSIDLRKLDGKKKLSKKRQASDSADAPNPKRRIHLKRDREAATPAKEPAPAGSHSQKEDAGDVAEELPVVPIPSLAPMPIDPVSPKETRISISLKKPSTEPELEMPLAPTANKTKRKKERANSPNPRKSPLNPRRSPTTEITAEIEIEAESESVSVKPVSKQMKRSASLEADSESGAESSPVAGKGVIGSRTSAFARKAPASKDPKDDASSSQAPSNSDGDAPPEAEEAQTTKAGRTSSRASSEASVPAGRSGRRAAQQAKEKLNSKPDPAVEKETGKRKKKRRRKDGGDSGGEESDHSEDDPQWVQCDSCAKWRILPSSVKASSLPKHWYCHLNIYDPKRNNCAAPEQTLKQVAKERRRAKKRAKQQRLEQVQLESIPEDSTAKEKGSSNTPVNSPKSTKVVISAKKLASISAESKRAAAAAAAEEPQQSDSGSDSLQKTEKKTRKGRQQLQQQQQQQLPEKDDSQHSGAEIPPEVPKVKVGRKRGRPARNTSGESGKPQEKKDDDNVQWVQCEKCEKWRKLPAHIDADELPDTWYCSMNTWNPDSASCESPEDKADASHLEVGRGQGQVPQGNPGKNSYRSLIFGTGRKHNRPLSERSRAAESLFMRPIDDEENPHPTVMYSKSSVFLPRTSNFTKSAAVEEKHISIFDVLSNSDLWTELSGFGQKPQNVISGAGVSRGYPKFITFENLPEEIRHAIRNAVLDALGSKAHTGDDLIDFMKSHSWDSEMMDLVPYFNADTIINALLALVRDGIVEMACFRDPTVPMQEWVPKYRRVRSKRSLASEEAMKASKCMKIRKPWKQREEGSGEWISGGAAFT